MRKAATIAFATVGIAGVIGVAIEAGTDDRDLAFTLGVTPSFIVAELPPGAEACQRPVSVEEGFRAVRLKAASDRNSYGPLTMRVAEATGGRTLARGELGGRFPASGAERPIRLDRDVPMKSVVAVCVRNAGRHGISLYGGPDISRAGSAVVQDGRRRPSDLALVFERREPRSVLSLLPDLFRHASVFHPSWVGPWTFWLLLALVLVAVPALLVVALRGAAADDDQSPATP